jgi:predicted DNA-binding transcriptional regulator AlpA
MTTSAFVTFGELAEFYNPGITKITLWRHEKRGIFPRRVKLSARRVVWRREECDEWQRDPEAWAAAHAQKSISSAPQ